MLMFIYRSFIFVIGLIFATTGMIFFVLYLALLNYGFTLGEFIVYLLKTKSFYLLPIGVFLMCFSLYFKNFWNRLKKIKEDQLHREHVSK